MISHDKRASVSVTLLHSITFLSARLTKLGSALMLEPPLTWNDHASSHSFIHQLCPSVAGQFEQKENTESTPLALQSKQTNEAPNRVSAERAHLFVCFFHSPLIFMANSVHFVTLPGPPLAPMARVTLECCRRGPVFVCPFSRLYSLE